MACPDPAGAVEQAFLAALGQVAAWRMDEQELVLLDDDGDELLRFAPASVAGEWTVTAFRQPGSVSSPLAGTELTATFGEDGKLSGTAGCNPYTRPTARSRARSRSPRPARAGWRATRRRASWSRSAPTWTRCRRRREYAGRRLEPDAARRRRDDRRHLHARPVSDAHPRRRAASDAGPARTRVARGWFARSVDAWHRPRWPARCRSWLGRRVSRVLAARHRRWCAGTTANRGDDGRSV